jgi:hypothetical protein
MYDANCERRPRDGHPWIRQICAIGMTLWFGAAPGIAAEDTPDPDKLAGQPAELSAWAYAYRADRKVQEKPEAYFVLRRLERLDRVYRPVSLLISQGNPKKGGAVGKPEGDWQLLAKKVVWERGELLPAPSGILILQRYLSLCPTCNARFRSA